LEDKDLKMFEDDGFSNIYNIKNKDEYSYKTIGLTEDVIKDISKQKKEPDWMLDLRLKALAMFNKLQMPTWGPDLSELDMSKIATYVKPKTNMQKSWNDVPDDIKNTFDALGIPEAEKESLAGVGAQYDSEIVYHSIKEELVKQGVIYTDFDEAVKKYPEIIFIGTEPAVKVAADANKGKKIIVLSTTITAKQEKLHNLIKNLDLDSKVKIIPADKLVLFAEDVNCKNNTEKVKEYMKKSFRMVFFFGFPLIFGLISVSDAFVPFFFGSGYKKTGTIMKVISPIILFIGLSNVTGTQYLLPTKRQKEYTLSVVFGACVNFVMNSLLIGRYGAIGASIGTVIAELTVTSVQLYYTRKDFDFKKVIGLTRNYLFASIIMFVCCKVTAHFITSNVISIIAQVVVGACIYGVILLIMKDEFLKEILEKLKGKLNRNKTPKGEQV